VIQNGDPRFVSCEIHDSVEVRKAEEVKGGAGSEDGGAMECARSVEKDDLEDFREDVLIEGEEGSKSHLEKSLGGEGRPGNRCWVFGVKKLKRN